MDAEQLKERARQFALAVIDLCLSLGHDDLARVIRPQLLRAGTGTVSSYRAACRSRSRREFVARMGVVAEETDEAELWLGVLMDKGRSIEAARPLRKEVIELRAIFAASHATAARNLAKGKNLKT